MLSKMKSYAASGEFRKALIIGQNLFGRDRGDMDIFRTYSSVLQSALEAAKTSEEKIQYLQQLSSVLTVFSETVNLDDVTVEFIMSQEDMLEELLGQIRQFQKQEEREFVKKKVVANDSFLTQVENTIDRLQKVSDKVSFDVLLQKLQQYDAAINKEYLTDRQKELYDSATQRCSQIVNRKVHMFERINDVEYNQQALEAYEKVYKYFKSGKVPTDHKDIISGLFGYDSKRLFNETLTYYNHVYAYVLSKLDDEGKFRLTKAAIHTEIRR